MDLQCQRHGSISCRKRYSLDITIYWHTHSKFAGSIAPRFRVFIPKNIKYQWCIAFLMLSDVFASGRFLISHPSRIRLLTSQTGLWLRDTKTFVHSTWSYKYDLRTLDVYEDRECRRNLINIVFDWCMHVSSNLNATTVNLIPTIQGSVPSSFSAGYFNVSSIEVGLSFVEWVSFERYSAWETWGRSPSTCLIAPWNTW